MQRTVWVIFSYFSLLQVIFISTICRIFQIHEVKKNNEMHHFSQSSTENPFQQLLHDEKYIFPPFFFFPFTRCRLISLMQYLRFFCSPNVMLRFFHNRSSVPLEQIAASLFLSRRQRDCLFLIEAFSRAFSPALCLALQLFSQHLPAVI